MRQGRSIGKEKNTKESNYSKGRGISSNDMHAVLGMERNSAFPRSKFTNASCSLGRLSEHFNFFYLR